ncbi:sorbosone dehydrogenase family protein [Bacillus sp. EAC]|uniref:PQQ-dependent sugar dehydrogenase n=1 Tax=Bacillus sp. EAC TaxID=1978338 RepID=UPI000B44B5FF|nr:sorbosone dehydrogenase family protein [Bacillus sp. EAC]
MKIVKVTLVSVLIVLLSACNLNWSLKNTENKNVSTASTVRNQNYVIVDNLKYPWSIDLMDNTFYMTERDGNILEVTNGKMKRQKLKTNKPIVSTGEGGLLGFVLTPNFTQTNQAYTYHTYKVNDSLKNRIILIEKTSNGWREVKSILEGIPGGQIHNGGRLAIGPDNHLYITTGDTGHDELAQNLKSLAGKILRLNLNGTTPNDNPFPNSLIYSYGHRNSQGIAWTNDGSMYASEHGPSPMGGHDEINKIEPGKNYGWPIIIGDEKKEGMVTPLYQTGDETWAPSGIKINDRNEILVSCLMGEKLIKYSISNGKLETVLDGVGRIRDVFLKDSAIYVITSNGENDKLLRISN